jgi:hypothetical protein
MNTEGSVESRTNQFSTKEETTHTHQWMLIMEGKDKKMDINVTTQQDDNSIRTKSDQITKDRSEHDYEQVTN